jgi:hypothetical protein
MYGVWCLTIASRVSVGEMSRCRKVRLIRVTDMLEGCFKVKEFVMELIKGDWIIMSLNCPGKLFVVITKALKDSF